MVKRRTVHQLLLTVIFSIGIMLLLGACQSATTPTAAPSVAPTTSAAVVPTIQPQPTPQPASTLLPPPDVAELQKTLAEQQLAITSLQNELKNFKAEVALELRDVRWQMEQQRAIAIIVSSIVGFILAFYGLRTRKEIKDVQTQIKQQIQIDLEQAEKGFRAALDKKLYNLDPASHPIRVRVGHPALDMLVERVRLTTSGFKVDDCTKIGDECKNGITIVPINDADDERQFMEAIQATSFDSKRAAFILYTPAYRIQPQTMKSYGNLAIANMPTTLVSAILAVARGLEPDKPQEPASTSA
jgi:preprotein translocase subunit SecE